jgi:hypothetical protein
LGEIIAADLRGHRQIGLATRADFILHLLRRWSRNVGTRAGLLIQEDFSKLLMFTEPKFGLWNRLCETRDHLGSQECRVRNGDADCGGAEDRDSDGNDRSDRESRNASTHVDPPS